MNRDSSQHRCSPKGKPKEKRKGYICSFIVLKQPHLAGVLTDQVGVISLKKEKKKQTLALTLIVQSVGFVIHEI